MEISITEIIGKKKNGLNLSDEELEVFINGVVNEAINDAQIGAMLMAMSIKGLSFRETVALTKAMISSGKILHFNKFDKNVLVDKHSTGGVGDKVSLILAPALAATGTLKVPMISGKSLGYTGGTLNKLESIPGFQISLSSDQMNNCLVKAGCFICSTSSKIAPADAILYKLRDITSTVDNCALIVSSILSKKAAEGIGVLVMDVKFGEGAFNKTEEEARELGKILMKTGSELNLIVKVVISEMNSPLGQYVGNSLEVIESIMCLKNEINSDLLDLVLLLGGIVLEAKGLSKTLEEGKRTIYQTLKDGTALNCFKEMLISQGVSQKNALELCSGNFFKVLTKAEHVTLLLSHKKGVIYQIKSLNVGKACWILGGGREKFLNQPNHSTGVILLKKVGDLVDENEPWIEVHHSAQALPLDVKMLLNQSLIVKDSGTIVEKKIAMRLLV